MSSTTASRRVWWHSASDGRFWLHFGARGCLHVQCVLGRFRFHLGFSTGSEEQDIGLTLCVPGLSLYLVLDGVLPYSALDRSWQRDTSVRIFDRKLWLALLCQDNVWPHKKGWSWTFDPVRFVFGRLDCTRETLSESVHRIPMPEANYEATVKMVRFRWKRRRLPWASQTVLKADVEIPDGIPHPGKGTMDYNCGPDATYGLCAPARDAEEAVGMVVASVLRDRRRYPL